MDLERDTDPVRREDFGSWSSKISRGDSDFAEAAPARDRGEEMLTPGLDVGRCWRAV